MSFAPNALGLYDLAGNVWEFCGDWYGGDYYASSPMNEPAGPETGEQRVIRGGSWDYSRWHCRTTIRGMSATEHSSGDIGFRIVKEIDE